MQLPYNGKLQWKGFQACLGILGVCQGLEFRGETSRMCCAAQLALARAHMTPPRTLKHGFLLFIEVESES